MNAGKFDRRVQLFRGAQVRNALSGQNQQTYHLWKTVWAQMVPINTAEPFESSTLRVKQTVIWNMRPVSGLTELDQLKHGGRTYKITGILETIRKRQIQVTTEVFE